MVERICPQCQHGNALENRFCGHCGAALERYEMVSSGPRADLVGMEHVPVHLKQLGKAVAVSLAALAAEAGIAWLRRRVEQWNQSPPSVRQSIQTTSPIHQTTMPTTIVVPAHTTDSGMVTIFSQRVVEIWEQGVLKRQTVERNVWRREQG